ncbi:unnamed protein product [Effrenium voratum]|nr:unnamed protein product [Effrenium voratum]
MAEPSDPVRVAAAEAERAHEDVQAKAAELAKADERLQRAREAVLAHVRRAERERLAKQASSERVEPPQEVAEGGLQGSCEATTTTRGQVIEKAAEKREAVLSQRPEAESAGENARRMRAEVKQPRHTIEAVDHSIELPRCRAKPKQPEYAQLELSTLEQRPSSVSLTVGGPAVPPATQARLQELQDASSRSSTHAGHAPESWEDANPTPQACQGGPRSSLPGPFAAYDTRRAPSPGPPGPPSRAVIAAVATVAKVKARQRQDLPTASPSPIAWGAPHTPGTASRMQSTPMLHGGRVPDEPFARGAHIRHSSSDYAMPRMDSWGERHGSPMVLHSSRSVGPPSWTELAVQAQESCQQALHAARSPGPFPGRTASGLEFSPSRSARSFDGAQSAPSQWHLCQTLPAPQPWMRTMAASPLQTPRVQSPGPCMQRSPVRFRSPQGSPCRVPDHRVVDVWLHEPMLERRSFAGPTAASNVAAWGGPTPVPTAIPARAPSPSHFILQAVAAPAPPQRHSPSLVQTPQQVQRPAQELPNQRQPQLQRRLC